MKRLFEAAIEDVIIQPSKIKPIIVNFQNGRLKDDQATKMSCGLFYDQKKEKSLLALSNGQVVYKGYKPDSKQDLTRTMLVVHNKKTGKVKLVEAERWQVGPVLQKLTIDDGKDTTDDKLALLNKQFGSKKAKRRTEQFERMKVNVASVQEELEKTVSKIELDKADMSAPLAAEFITNTHLPECNRNTTNIKDVYNAYDIVPKDKLETLYEKAMDVLESNLERKSKFFTHTLQYLKSSPDNIQKVAILLYIDAVATWMNMPMKDAKKRGVIVCPFSQDVNSYVIETYSTLSFNGRLRPNTMRDKAIIHCMILGLIISNFALDLEIFSTIFTSKIGIKKLTDFTKIISAVTSKEDKKIIHLKLPLPAQVSVIKKVKGRKK